MVLEVKNLPANEETQEKWAPSLGWEDRPEEGMATHSSVLAWRIPWTAAYQAPLSMGYKEVDTTE